jgi:hypothetical protein
MASQKEKSFCVLRFDMSRSVITVQREFRARFKRDVNVVYDYIKSKSISVTGRGGP